MPPQAIVKFGSTSTTLLVAQRLDHPLLRRQQLINLYAADGPAQALKVAEELRQAANDAGTVPLAAGGEALRDNPELEIRLRQLYPNWWHLTAETEGRLAWIAVKARHPSCDVVVDIGGGSTEFISQRQVVSVPQGAARSARHAIRWPALSAFERPVVIGGTAVALKWWTGRPGVRLGDVEAMQQALMDHPEQFQTWDPLRRSILPVGLSLLGDVFHAAGWDSIEVSERGLTEGLWLAASLGRGIRL